MRMNRLCKVILFSINVTFVQAVQLDGNPLSSTLLGVDYASANNTTPSTSPEHQSPPPTEHTPQPIQPVNPFKKAVFTTH